MFIRPLLKVTLYCSFSLIFSCGVVSSPSEVGHDDPFGYLNNSRTDGTDATGSNPLQYAQDLVQIDDQSASTPPVLGCEKIEENPFWRLCESGPNTCSGVFTNGAGCKAFCAAAGMECLVSYAGGAGCTKAPSLPLNCSENAEYTEQWCTCGGGQPQDPPIGNDPITDPEPDPEPDPTPEPQPTPDPEPDPEPTIEPCSQCWGPGNSSCTDACNAAGYDSGQCVVPDSTDQGNCCGCWNEGAPTPDPGPGPAGAPDLGSVTWLHTNVSSWPVTANLSSVTFGGGQICMEYNKKHEWPIDTVGAENVEIVANPWIFMEQNGQWYAATWEWLRPGQTCKNMSSVAGDHIKQPPFHAASGWTPTSGQTYYIMVSAPARMGPMTVLERSNIVQVVWP